MLVKYLRGVGVLGLTEVLLRLKALILMPILTKYFGAVNYGIWAQVSVLVSMLTPLMMLGTDSAALRFLPGQSAQSIRRGFSTLLVYYSIVSLAVGTILWASSDQIASGVFGDSSNAKFVILCGGVTFASLLTGLCRNFYRLTGRVTPYSIVNIAQSLYSAAIGLVVANSQGSILDVVLATLVADVLLGLILLSQIVITFGLAQPDWGILTTFVRFGIPLVPAGYAMWALNLVDRLFIVNYGTLQDVGVYSLIYALGYMLISLFFNPIYTMYPSTAADLYNRGELNELRRLFKHSTRLALGLVVPSIIGVGVLGKPIVGLLSSDEFARGAPLIPIITLAYTFHMLSSYYDVTLGLVGRQVWSTIAIGAGASINILLNYILIPVWGIGGAALATLIGFGVQFLLSVWFGSRQIRLGFDWPFLMKICTAAVIMGAVVAAFPVQGILTLTASTVTGICVYTCTGLALKAVDPVEWRGALQAIRAKTL